jgi:hypothetical protein
MEVQMRDYGMDYNRDRSGWMGGSDRGYDAQYGQGWGGRDRGALDYGGWDRGDRWTGSGGMNRGGAFQGRGGEYDDFGGGPDHGYERTTYRPMRGRGETMDRGGMMHHGYGRDYGEMNRGGFRGEEDEPRFFRHWAGDQSDEDYDWESGRHGVPRNVGRGMSHGGNERWLDDNGYPRGYRGSGVHNYGGGGRDHFRAYGANFRLGYDPRW